MDGDIFLAPSDNPVMIINIITQNATPFTDGLVQLSTAVYYPLSSQLLLCAMHSEITSGATSEIDCSLLDLNANKEVMLITTI